MNLYLEQKDCTGCTACASICPAGAITMAPDPVTGFLYPVIDGTCCTDCGLCADACPERQPDHYKNAEQPVYHLAKHRQLPVRLGSTSGGAFTALSDAMLARGGVVYGALWAGDYRLVHGRAADRETRDKMRFSKYVQSDLRGVYAQVEQDLAAGIPVLFTGTPCQNAGLKAALRDRGAESLVLCDLICYGVPSPRIWEDYKALLRQEHPGAADFRFRSKQLAWSRENSNTGFLFTDGAGVRHMDDRLYRMFFVDKTVSRPSCAACPWCDSRRVGDLTIADYWGIEEYAPEKYDPTGLSVILCSSPAGAALLAEAASALELERRDPAEQLKHQGRLHEPVAPGPGKEQFWAAIAAGTPLKELL